MDFDDWAPYYRQVVEDLGLDEEADLHTARHYRALVAEVRPAGYLSPVRLLGRSYPTRNPRVWVFGAGPSLPNDFNLFAERAQATDLVVAADGAALFLLKEYVTPQVVFSDLDGSAEALTQVGEEGGLLVLHGHGDNWSLVDDLFPPLARQYAVVPTVQTRPDEPYLYNWGGFTDGDRCVAGVLDWFPSSPVMLLGFTFGTTQGRFSKPNQMGEDRPAPEFKLRKLAFAKQFLSEFIAKRYPGQVWNGSRPTDPVVGISEEVGSFPNPNPNPSV